MRRMKLALACPTVGQTQRGYERFFTDLHREMGPSLAPHLFKGGGESGPRETVLAHLRRTGVLSQLCGRRLAWRRYQLEHLSFAARLAPALQRGGHDVVHVIDPPLLSHLLRLRRWGLWRGRVLFTQGGPAIVEPGPDVDHVHCLTVDIFERMQALGVPGDKLTLLPVGISRDHFTTSAPRAALRARQGIADDAFVVLCLGAVNRHHKRIDHVTAEIAAAGAPVQLWLDGSLHPDGEPALLTQAQAALGARFRHTQVPSAEVGDLLAMADVLVSAALDESFGMAVVEAMSAGVPVLVHDNAHFRALAGDGAHHVDMAAPGALATALRAMAAGERALQPAQDPRAAVAHLSWRELVPKYADMYRRVAHEAPVHGAQPAMHA
jgi:1,2-diacylglycerol 3-alpha-glucosyltransferase